MADLDLRGWQGQPDLRGWSSWDAVATTPLIRARSRSLLVTAAAVDSSLSCRAAAHPRLATTVAAESSLSCAVTAKALLVTNIAVAVEVQP